MAAQNKTGTPKKAKNPLLTGADLGFPFDNLCGSAILMPIAHEETTVPASVSNVAPTSFLQPEPTPVPAPLLPNVSSAQSTPLFTLFKQVLTGERPAFVQPSPNNNNSPPDSVPLYASPVAQPCSNSNEQFQSQENNNNPPPRLFSPGQPSLHATGVNTPQTFTPGTVSAPPPRMFSPGPPMSSEISQPPRMFTPGGQQPGTGTPPPRMFTPGPPVSSGEISQPPRMFSPGVQQTGTPPPRMFTPGPPVSSGEISQPPRMFTPGPPLSSGEISQPPRMFTPGPPVSSGEISQPPRMFTPGPPMSSEISQPPRMFPPGGQQTGTPPPRMFTPGPPVSSEISQPPRMFSPGVQQTGTPPPKMFTPGPPLSSEISQPPRMFSPGVQQTGTPPPKMFTPGPPVNTGEISQPPRMFTPNLQGTNTPPQMFSSNIQNSAPPVNMYTPSASNMFPPSVQNTPPMFSNAPNLYSTTQSVSLYSMSQQAGTPANYFTPITDSRPQSSRSSRPPSASSQSIPLDKESRPSSVSSRSESVGPAPVFYDPSNTPETAKLPPAMGSNIFRQVKSTRRYAVGTGNQPSDYFSSPASLPSSNAAPAMFSPNPTQSFPPQMFDTAVQETQSFPPMYNPNLPTTAQLFNPVQSEEKKILNIAPPPQMQPPVPFESNSFSQTAEMKIQNVPPPVATPQLFDPNSFAQKSDNTPPVQMFTPNLYTQEGPNFPEPQHATPQLFNPNEFTPTQDFNQHNQDTIMTSSMPPITDPTMSQQNLTGNENQTAPPIFDQSQSETTEQSDNQQQSTENYVPQVCDQNVNTKQRTEISQPQMFDPSTFNQNIGETQQSTEHSAPQMFNQNIFQQDLSRGEKEIQQPSENAMPETFNQNSFSQNASAPQMFNPNMFHQNLSGNENEIQQSTENVMPQTFDQNNFSQNTSGAEPSAPQMFNPNMFQQNLPGEVKEIQQPTEDLVPQSFDQNSFSQNAGAHEPSTPQMFNPNMFQQNLTEGENEIQQPTEDLVPQPFDQSTSSQNVGGTEPPRMFNPNMFQQEGGKEIQQYIDNFMPQANDQNPTGAEHSAPQMFQQEGGKEIQQYNDNFMPQANDQNPTGAEHSAPQIFQQEGGKEIQQYIDNFMSQANVQSITGAEHSAPQMFNPNMFQQEDGKEIQEYIENFVPQTNDQSPTGAEHSAPQMFQQEGGKEIQQYIDNFMPQSNDQSTTGAEHSAPQMFNPNMFQQNMSGGDKEIQQPSAPQMFDPTTFQQTTSLETEMSELKLTESVQPSTQRNMNENETSSPCDQISNMNAEILTPPDTLSPQVVDTDNQTNSDVETTSKLDPETQNQTIPTEANREFSSPSPSRFFVGTNSTSSFFDQPSAFVPTKPAASHFNESPPTTSSSNVNTQISHPPEKKGVNQLEAEKVVETRKSPASYFTESKSNDFFSQQNNSSPASFFTPARPTESKSPASYFTTGNAADFFNQPQNTSAPRKAAGVASYFSSPPDAHQTLSQMTPPVPMFSTSGEQKITNDSTPFSSAPQNTSVTDNVPLFTPPSTSAPFQPLTVPTSNVQFFNMSQLTHTAPSFPYNATQTPPNTPYTPGVMKSPFFPPPPSSQDIPSSVQNNPTPPQQSVPLSSVPLFTPSNNPPFASSVPQDSSGQGTPNIPTFSQQSVPLTSNVPLFTPSNNPPFASSVTQDSSGQGPPNISTFSQQSVPLTSNVPLFTPSNIPAFTSPAPQNSSNQAPQNFPLTSGVPLFSSTAPPASIPVSVSQIKLPCPKNETVTQNVLQTGLDFAGQENRQFQEQQQQAASSPPPPPKSAMSGGNNNTFRLGSRPQYAPPPGLGSSVSAIASLAASMAMSTPLPVPGSSPIHHDPLPMPSIVASAPGISSASELFRPQSATGGEPSAATYRPVYHHWFYKREIEGKAVWNPFSMSDSMELEKAFTSGDKTAVVATDGGRYDVHVSKRLREPVYWSQPANEVRRCSWFYRGALDSRSHPYEEAFAEKLEEEYRCAFISNRWPRRIEVSYGEAIVLNGPTAMMHLPPTSGSIMEDWGSIQEQGTKPRSVRRGCDEFDIDEGEQARPDHLLFLVHGIGSVCDLKFRSVVEVVDDFRSMALTLVRSHFRQAGDEGRVSRVEVLPVSWHGALHGEETGIDQQLQGITLKSIPRLRHFTNDTLLDILFYTSPVYCQTIIRTVGHELNRLQQLFMKRNPDFCGGISLGGHSLGSLILFDLLCHQKPLPKTRHASPPKDPLLFDADEAEEEDEFGEPMPPPRHLVRRESCRVDYMMGPAGTGQPSISYPQLHFNPSAFFALGSPIAMFVTVRGIESLGREFCLPTCPGFFNIFHPFDPVAYRVEALIDQELSKLRPVVIPHHKGRKRMHIELRETMTRVGADLKERLVDSVRSTWNTVYQLAMFNRGETLEQEVDKVLAEQMLAQDAAMAEDAGLTDAYTDWGEPDTALMGKLNSGRRVDYVLQEAPLESFNEYLFALGSHVCYWESEDTMLLMLREIYNMLGVTPDKQFDRSREGSVARERSWSAGSRGSGTSPSQQRFLSAGRPTPPFSTPPSSVSKQ